MEDGQINEHGEVENAGKTQCSNPEPHTLAAAKITTKKAAALSPTCIRQPRPSDVLFGRGKPYQGHFGNRKLREIVGRYRKEYLASRRYDKLAIAEEIVKGMQGGRWGNPARFLRRVDDGEDFWEEVSDSVAREKVSHTLRGKRKEQNREGLNCISDQKSGQGLTGHVAMPYHHGSPSIPSSGGEVGNSLQPSLRQSLFSQPHQANRGERIAATPLLPMPFAHHQSGIDLILAQRNQNLLLRQPFMNGLPNSDPDFGMARHVASRTLPLSVGPSSFNFNHNLHEFLLREQLNKAIAAKLQLPEVSSQLHTTTALLLPSSNDERGGISTGDAAQHMSSNARLGPR